MKFNVTFQVIYDFADMATSENAKLGSKPEKAMMDNYALYAAIPTNVCLPSFKVVGYV